MTDFIFNYWFVIAWFIAIVLILAFNYGASVVSGYRERRIRWSYRFVNRRNYPHNYWKIR